MRNVIPVLFFALSLLLAGDVLAQGKSQTAPKRQNEPKQVDAISKIKRYLDDNCVVALKTYSTNPSNQKVSLEGEATGFLAAVQGTSYVFTNAHVARGATDIWALFDHGIPPQELRFKGRDDALDVALLTFADKTFRAPCAMPLGDSDTLSTGDEVFTLGNHPFLYYALSKGYVMKTNTVVLGIADNKFTGINALRLSAIYSELNLNPGSSGGPLLNAKGEVVGMNQGASYKNVINPASLSIPINLIKRGLPEILKGGNVPHGIINVFTVDSGRFSPLDKYTTEEISTRFRNGPIVMLVPFFSSAERAGIQKDDMIVAVNGTPTPTVNDLFTLMVFTLQPGTVAKVTVLREEDRAGTKEQVYKEIDVIVEELHVTFK